MPADASELGDGDSTAPEADAAGDALASIEGGLLATTADGTSVIAASDEGAGDPLGSRTKARIASRATAADGARDRDRRDAAPDVGGAATTWSLAATTGASSVAQREQ